MTTRTRPTFPLPSQELRERVGGAESEAEYLRVGRRIAEDLLASLPPDWSFEGKRVLDFGAGAGRVLRHLLDAAAGADEFAAVDIDEASVAWLKKHLRPPFVAHHVGALPPLPFPDASFDLVYALSVFTHLTDTWWAWLKELRRVTRPGGLVLASFLERRPYEATLAEPFVADRVGMVRLREWQDFEQGGPLVFHSEWWIRENWGTVFEIVDVLPDRVDGWQHLALMQATSTALPESPTPPPNRPTARHVHALETSARLLGAESAAIRRELDLAVAHQRDLNRRIADLETHRRAVEGERDQLERLADDRLKQLELIQSTLSWRLTRPLRALRRLQNARRTGGTRGEA